MWKREAMGPHSPLISNPSTGFEDKKVWDVESTPKKLSVFGAAIQLEGIIRGEDDVLLNGKIKGRIELPGNTVTIGVEGFLEGDIFAQVVVVEGAVKGNIRASERVIFHSTAQLVGNVSSDRMSIEEGARINGSIDMAPTKESRKEPHLSVVQNEHSDEEEEESLSH